MTRSNIIFANKMVPNEAIAIILTPLCSSRQAGSNDVSDDLERSNRDLDLRSSQSQGQVGQDAYHKIRLDETNTLVPLSRFYLHPVVICWQKTV